MAFPLVSDVLKQVTEKKTREEKIQHLRYHRQNPVMIEFFKYVYNPAIKFALPEGDPPYKVAEDLEENYSGLYQELRKMYIFLEGGMDIKPVKREMQFIETLERIHPKEAKLLLLVKDKKLPEGITRDLVDEALPGLLPKVIDKRKDPDKNPSWEKSQDRIKMAEIRELFSTMKRENPKLTKSEFAKQQDIGYVRMKRYLKGL